MPTPDKRFDDLTEKLKTLQTELQKKVQGGTSSSNTSSSTQLPTIIEEIGKKLQLFIADMKTRDTSSLTTEQKQQQQKLAEIATRIEETVAKMPMETKMAMKGVIDKVSKMLEQIPTQQTGSRATKR